VVLCGDFKQVFPVVKGGSRDDIIDSLLIKSPLWKHVTMLRRAWLICSETVWLCEVIVGLPRPCYISATFWLLKEKTHFLLMCVPCLQLFHAIFDFLILPLSLFLHFG
jgi:hypothetical protein